MTAITASAARKRLYKLVDEVKESHRPVQIVGKRNFFPKPPATYRGNFIGANYRPSWPCSKISPGCRARSSWTDMCTWGTDRAWTAISFQPWEGTSRSSVWPNRSSKGPRGSKFFAA